MTIPEDAIEYSKPKVMYKDGLKFVCKFEEGDKIFCNYFGEEDFVYVFKIDEMESELVEKIDEILDYED